MVRRCRARPLSGGFRRRLRRLFSCALLPGWRQLLLRRLLRLVLLHLLLLLLLLLLLRLLLLLQQLLLLLKLLLLQLLLLKLLKLLLLDLLLKLLLLLNLLLLLLLRLLRLLLLLLLLLLFSLLLMMLIPLLHDLSKTSEVDKILVIPSEVAEDAAVPFILGHRKVAQLLENHHQPCLILAAVDVTRPQGIYEVEGLSAQARPLRGPLSARWPRRGGERGWHMRKHATSHIERCRRPRGRRQGRDLLLAPAAWGCREGERPLAWECRRLRKGRRSCKT